MTNTSFNILFILLLFQITFSESIAIASKVKGDVKYKQKKESSLKNQLKTGIDLYNNDFIRTGTNGFAKYVYLDDGTEIKVHKNSEVYIRGDLEKRSIIKQLKVEEGTIKLEIKKQKDGINEFTVITPTSVASVKGTSFWLNCDGENGDKFYGESGIVSIQNIESGVKRELVKNTVANSLPDGSLDIRKITQNELNMLNNIEEDTGESGNSSNGGDSSDSEESEIKIEFEDESGNQKTIIIKIK